MAKGMGAVVGFVTKKAYHRLMSSKEPGYPYPRGMDWKHVEDYVRRGETEKLPKPVRDAIAANEPIIIDVDPEGHSHQWILHGKKLYYLENLTHIGGVPLPKAHPNQDQWPFRRDKD